MSSEAITRNDLSAILNEVLPPTPSEYQKLLWTNPNPTSAFAPQTISLDLSNYDAVDVEFRHWTDKDCRITTRNYLNEGEGVGIGTSTNNASYGNYRRGFKMHTNGVQFWGGLSNANVDNNSTIPVRIWGIKFERVAPPQVEYPNYSTEEQQVGTWIDGKPIYRKVIPTNLTAGLNAITAPSNIDIFVTLRGMEKESGGAQAPIPKAHNNTFAYQIGMYYSGGNIYIEAGSNLTNITSAYIICEYTKTTD